MQVYFWSIEDGNKHACPTMQGSSRFDFYLLTNHRQLTNVAGGVHFLSAQMALVSTSFHMGCITLKASCFCVMAERSHGKKSNRLSNPMGYEEVHIEYSTAQLLPTFPRGTPSDQPSVDSAADAAPPPPHRPTSRRRAALCEDHRSSTFAQRSREALLYSLQSLLNTLDRKNCIMSDT